MSRNTYHSSLKIAYSMGLERNWIHPSFLKSIPASTSHYWRKEDQTKYLGFEFANDIDNHLNNIQKSFSSIVSVERSVFFAYVKLKIMLFQVLGKQNILKALSQNKAHVVKVMQSVMGSISVSDACRWMKLPKKTFYHWREVITQQCVLSPFSLCVRKHPNQASLKEVKTMKKLLFDPELKHWGIASVWGYALKNNQVHLSLSTWYRYNKILGLRKTKTKGGKPKDKPLRASHIHQIWHADITVFKTLDNTRHYIYTVIDNYSRKILTWRVEPFVSAQVRVETIRKAMKDFPAHAVRLITDGGPENDNRTIKTFIDQSKTDINHQIALRDIVQSNSMVEASYKTLKYRCLYRKEIAHGDQLKKVLTDFFYEYNHVRPHYALGIYTPDEVEQGADLKLKNQSPLLVEAAIKRRENNRKESCKGC